MFSFETSLEQYVESKRLKCSCKRQPSICAEHSFSCPIGQAREQWSALGREMWARIHSREALVLDIADAREQRVADRVAVVNADRMKLDTAMKRGVNESHA